MVGLGIGLGFSRVLTVSAPATNLYVEPEYHESEYVE